MEKKSLEWHEYKRDIYKKARMWASMTCEELAIEGIEARRRLKASKRFQCPKVLS